MIKENTARITSSEGKASGQKHRLNEQILRYSNLPDIQSQGIQYDNGHSRETTLYKLYCALAKLHEDNSENASEYLAIIAELEIAIVWYEKANAFGASPKQGLYLYVKIAEEYEAQCATLNVIAFEGNSLHKKFDPFNLERPLFIEQYEKFDVEGKRLLEKAFNWYSKGAIAGSCYCAQILACCYAKDIVVEHDDNVAYEWLIKCLIYYFLCFLYFLEQVAHSLPILFHFLN